VKKKYDSNRAFYDAKAQGANLSSINRVSYINQPTIGVPTPPTNYPTMPQQQMIAPVNRQPEQPARFQSSIVFPKVSAVNKIQDNRYEKVFPSIISSSEIKRNFSNKVDMSKIVTYVKSKEKDECR